jgi:hypothetical protein
MWFTAPPSPNNTHAMIDIVQKIAFMWPSRGQI